MQGLSFHSRKEYTDLAAFTWLHEPQMEDTAIGILLAILSVTLWGASNTTARVGLQSIKAASGAILSTATALIIALVITLILDYQALVSVSLAHIGWFALVGVIHFALGRLFQYQSMKYIGAARGASITNAFPLFTLIFAFVFLKETLTIPLLIGTLSIVGGISLLLTESKETISTRRSHALGYCFGLATALCWGGSAVLIKHSSQFGPPFVVLTFALLSGMLALSVTTAKSFEIRLKTDKKAIGWLLLAGLIQGIALISYFSALALAPVVVVTPLAATSPLATILYVHLFLQRLERITRQMLIACLLVVIGAALVSIY